jgi:hypothetical protein
VSDGHRTPQATELVYVPPLSWAPALTAVGLAGLLIGLYAGWPYAAAGAILLLAAVRSWIRTAADEMRRLPRSQTATSAVLPAAPLRSASERPPSEG